MSGVFSLPPPPTRQPAELRDAVTAKETAEGKKRDRREIDERQKRDKTEAEDKKKEQRQKRHRREVL